MQESVRNHRRVSSHTVYRSTFLRCEIKRYVYVQSSVSCEGTINIKADVVFISKEGSPSYSSQVVCASFFNKIVVEQDATITQNQIYFAVLLDVSQLV